MKKCYNFEGFVTKNLQLVKCDNFNNIDTFVFAIYNHNRG